MPVVRLSPIPKRGVLPGYVPGLVSRQGRLSLRRLVLHAKYSASLGRPGSISVGTINELALAFFSFMSSFSMSPDRVVCVAKPYFRNGESTRWNTNAKGDDESHGSTGRNAGRLQENSKPYAL